MEISLPVTLAVLGAALLHASWNALVKASADKDLDTVAVAVGAGVVAAAAAPLLPLPAPASWPWLAGSAAVHILYFPFLAGAYRWGEFSYTYPIMRGGGPMIVAVVGAVALGEVLPWAQTSGVALICAGILGFASGAHHRSATLYALANAVVFRRPRRGDRRDGARQARARGSALSRQKLAARGARRTVRGRRLRDRALGDDAGAGGAGGGAARDLGDLRRRDRGAVPQGALHAPAARRHRRGAGGTDGIAALGLRPHVRKQDHVADRRAVGEQHHQPVHADAGARRRRQAVLERADAIRA